MEAPAASWAARVLLIEDDLEMADEILSELADHGYDVCHAASGLDGAALAESGMSDSDLLIVDRMLPELDGLAIIERVRERSLRTPGAGPRPGRRE